MPSDRVGVTVEGWVLWDEARELALGALLWQGPIFPTRAEARRFREEWFVGSDVVVRRARLVVLPRDGKRG